MPPQDPVLKSGTGIAAELSALKDAFTLSEIPRGTQLYTPGDPADRIFVLSSGRVKISIPGMGGKQCILQIVEPGGIFGECALFEEQSRRSAAEVIQNSSLKAIPRDALLAHAKRHPDFWESFSAHLNRRVQALEERIEWITFLEVGERVARFLLRWSATHERTESGDVRLQLSQRDIAGLVGATRETTSAALNRLQRDGCISIQRRCVVIQSEQSLAERAKSFRADRLGRRGEAAAAAAGSRSL